MGLGLEGRKLLNNWKKGALPPNPRGKKGIRLSRLPYSLSPLPLIKVEWWNSVENRQLLRVARLGFPLLDIGTNEAHPVPIEEYQWINEVGVLVIATSYNLAF
jgi:hypothetical protein